MGRSYRRYWMPELVILLLLTVGTSLLFRFTDLDVRLARFFYHPSNPDNPWPLKDIFPWRWLYDFGTVPGILLGLGAGVVLIVSFFRPSLHRLQLYCLFLGLAMGLGPGLSVNTILKDHWGRPRPNQTQAFGGKWQHLPLLQPGQGGKGKSFPCGHSSMGFYIASLYFIFRRRRPALALAVLALAVVYGTLIGIARMAAGAHYASDVAWSFFMPFLITLLLYYFVFRIPAWEDGAPSPFQIQPRWRKPVFAFIVFLFLAGVTIFLLTVPVYQDIEFFLPATRGNRAAALALRCPRTDVSLHVLDHAPGALTIRGEGHGFGFPNNRIAWTANGTNGPAGPMLCFEIHPHGVYGELEIRVRIELDRTSFREVRIDIPEGNLTVYGDPTPTVPPMDVKVSGGEISLPEEWRSVPMRLDRPTNAVFYRPKPRTPPPPSARPI